MKPLVFEKFYRKGAAECEDRPAVFNQVFDEVVFNWVSVSYGHITSPRRYGNMKSHVPKNGKQPPGDIGQYQYKKRIGDKTFRALRLREREELGPLTKAETAHLRYEEARRKQRREQVAEWQEKRKKTGRGGREEGSILGGLGRLLDGDNS